MDSTKPPHPDAARHDEMKEELKRQIDSFDAAPFNDAKARERLAMLLGQIHAQRWDHTPDAYDYNLADEFISIVRIDKFEDRDK